MRVAMVLPELTLRGSIRRSGNLVRQLSVVGHDVAVIYPGGAMERSFEQLDCLKLRYEVGEVGDQPSFIGLRDLLQQVRRFRPDIMHVSSLSWPTPWRGLSKGLDCPVVATVHADIEVGRIDKGMWNLLDAIIAVNQNVRVALNKVGQVASNRIFLIRPGVPVLEEDMKAQVLERLNSEFKPVIASYGPLRNREALLTLLRAGRKLRDKGVEFQLLIVGDGECSQDIREWINANDAGIWVVLINELFDHDSLYASASVVVAVDDTHDCVQFALEAMGQGIPAVLAASGGNFELIDDESTGLLYPADEPDSLAWRLERMLKDSNFRSKIALAGLEHARARLRIRDMTTQTIAVYTRCIKGTLVAPSLRRRKVTGEESSASWLWRNIIGK